MRRCFAPVPARLANDAATPSDSCRSLARVLGALLVLGAAVAHGADRPSILWITAEDMSPNLGCYGDPEAHTPRIDAFARESIRYTHAFATAPVCSPSRSALITGTYATDLGTQRLRSEFPIPPLIQPFSAFLREAGYYCTNNVKTDYNIAHEAEFIKAGWDESSPSAHWRARKKDQPFFSVFNLMTTHQSRTSVWPEKRFEKEVGNLLSPGERADAARLTLPPFYPDTPAARKAWARYRDCITRMDQQVGEILDQLAADGLAEDTIVFFFSDHGMGMPRGKRCLYDSGMRVPLLVRIPQKWQHIATDFAFTPRTIPVAGVALVMKIPAAGNSASNPPGSVTDRLVSFIDFAPTVLNLCGVMGRGYMQGNRFLGQDSGRVNTYVYGARDRVDEAFDLSRSARDKRWLYIRNYMPHLPWMQPEAFSDQSPFRRELKRLADKGELKGAAQAYAHARRPLEELYDTVSDPHQTRNLAANPEHDARLRMMRASLADWQKRIPDVGFLPEPIMWARLADEETPYDYARKPGRYSTQSLAEIAGCVGREESVERQREGLTLSPDHLRYWAAVGLNAREKLEEADRTALRKALRDEVAVVRIEAASALARHGEPQESLKVLTAALTNEMPEVVLHAARALELLGPVAAPVRAEMQAALDRAYAAEQKGRSPVAMYIRFSLEAALEE